MEVEKDFRTAGAVALIGYATVLLTNAVLVVVMAAFGTAFQRMLVGSIIGLSITVPISILILLLGLQFRGGRPMGVTMFVLLLLYSVLFITFSIFLIIAAALGWELGFGAFLAPGVFFLIGGIFALIAEITYRGATFDAMVKGGILGVVAASILMAGVLSLPEVLSFAGGVGLLSMPLGVLGVGAVLVGAVGVLLYPLFLGKKSPFMTYIGLSGAALLYGIACVVSGATLISLPYSGIQILYEIEFASLDTALLTIMGVLSIVAGILILIAAGFGIAASALASGVTAPPRPTPAGPEAKGAGRCPNCGAELEPGAKFCGGCGRKVK